MSRLQTADKGVIAEAKRKLVEAGTSVLVNIIYIAGMSFMSLFFSFLKPLFPNEHIPLAISIAGATVTLTLFLRFFIVLAELLVKLHRILKSDSDLDSP